jgi:hypothetical protein
MAGGPLEAPEARFKIQRGIARLASRAPRLNALSARSLSIAEGQISDVYFESNRSSVNRLSTAMEFGTLSNRSVFLP